MDRPSPFQKILNVWVSSNIASGIARLISGAVLAQIIGIAVTPIVTRLYSPSEYASMALFVSIVTITVSVSSGRYDTAVPLPPESGRGEQEALRLVLLAMTTVLATSIAGALVIVLSEVLAVNPWKEQLGPWVYALPLAAFLVAFNQILFQYANRKREYRRLSTITPASKIVTSALQVGLGQSGWGRVGLLVPAILSPIVGITILIRILRDGARSTPFTALEARPSKMWTTAIKYRDFPLIATWISLINSLNSTIQIFVLSLVFTSSDVGQYALAMTLISIPVSVIAGSVSSVYFRELASRSGDTASSLALTRNTTVGLISVATFPVILIGVSATHLFPIIFGPQWSEAGRFAVALLPWACMRLIGIPLSAALAVTRKQLWQLLWQVALLIGFVAAYILGAWLGADAVTCTWIASIVSVPMYLILVPMVYSAIRGQETQEQAEPSPT